MNLRFLRHFRAFCLIVLGFMGAAPSVDARDNFLLIIADDLGVDSLAVYSDDLAYGHVGEGADHGPTPRLDTLASEGILFRHAYTNPLCAPSRAQILTGRHAMRTGVGTPGGAVLDLAETTLPEILAGTHSSAAIGKWHVGPGGDVDHPIDSGFDYFAGALNGNISDYEDWQKTINSAGGSDTVIPNHLVYATDDNSAEAIAKIAEFGEAPWIVYLAFNAPHSPFHVPTQPLTTAVTTGSSSHVKYEAMIEAMDREIGDVLDSIPASILADTTIIFIGDNGTPTGVTRPPFLSSHGKGTVYDGGTNVPLIIKSPHVAVAGTESLAFVQSTDIFATIAEIGGVVSEAEDSISMVPYLSDATLPTQSARPYAYAEQFTPNGAGIVYTDHERAIRDGQYKLIWRNDVYEEFFDLTANPFEDANLLPYAGMTEEQQAAYDALLQQMTAVETAGDGACPSRTDVSCTVGYLKAKFEWREGGGLGDKATIKLAKGPAQVQTDFGNPVSVDGTGYSVCVYDDADVIVGEMRVVRSGDLCSGKDCWKPVGNDAPDGKGYKFKDKLGASSGVLKMQLKGGDAEKSKLKIIGRGFGLPDGVTGALQGSTSATVQVRGSDMAQCLGATVTEITRHDVDHFKATN
ncbi:MAG: sulfatase-like hydrolase/transferase [Candidatus Binatia bacterium]|nr:sulfatase-like hydrolase/transferase [Candidatus Binatia bacterium]